MINTDSNYINRNNHKMIDKNINKIKNNIDYLIKMLIEAIQLKNSIEIYSFICSENIFERSFTFFRLL